MAMDTAQERASSIQFLKPFSVSPGPPDGIVTPQGVYIGIPASPPPFSQPYILRLMGIPTMGKRDRPGGWN